MPATFRVSAFPHERKPTLYFTLAEEGKAPHVQYGIRPPRTQPGKKELIMHEETTRLTRMGGNQGDGRRLIAFIHEVIQDYATHVQKNIRVRLDITNSKVKEWMENNGFKETDKGDGPSWQMEGLIRPGLKMGKERQARIESLLEEIRKAGG